MSGECERLSAPCRNGGVCVNISGGYTCQCPYGTLQPFCEVLGKFSASSTRKSDQIETEEEYSVKLEIVIAVLSIVIVAFIAVVIWAIFYKPKKAKQKTVRKKSKSKKVKYERYEIQRDIEIQQLQRSFRSPQRVMMPNESGFHNHPRPCVSTPQQNHAHTGRFNYFETVRNYEVAMDELELTRITTVNSSLQSSNQGPTESPRHQDHEDKSQERDHKMNIINQVDNSLSYISHRNQNHLAKGEMLYFRHHFSNFYGFSVGVTAF